MTTTQAPTAEKQISATAELLERIAAPAHSSTAPVRLLIVLAHPDDEVLAMGARLERLQASRILTLTDGAPVDGADARAHGFASLEAYRQARRDELLAALADAGLGAEIAPVFAGAVSDQSASLHLAQLARAVHREIEAFHPDAVLTHPYEGGHPDHDACAFAVRAAVRLAARSSNVGGMLQIVEAPSYHADAHGRMITGCFLKIDPQTKTVVWSLTAEEQRSKQRRLRCFPSQAETLAQFGMECEMFRVAPEYDFTQRPHAGQLFYEQFPWGMKGEHFCELASAALQELFGTADDGVMAEAVLRQDVTA